MKKRVVITGMEITSSLGTGIEKFWQAASQGRCGIKRIEAYDPSPYTTQIGGEITDLCLDQLPQFNKSKRYPKAAQYALYCTHHAIERSGLSATELSSAGTYIGTSLGGHPELEVGYKIFFTEHWKKIPPLSVSSVSPVFEKPAGTSKSPAGTKTGDKYASGGPGRPGPP